MIYAVQIVIGLWMLLLTAAMLVMIRQIGVLSRRIPKEEGGIESTALAQGEEMPMKEWRSYDGVERVSIADQANSCTVLLFSSFGCAVCRRLLEELRHLSSEYSERMILMMLDRGHERIASGVQSYGLERYSIVEALDYADVFRISRTPFAYAVDEDGLIIAATVLLSVRDLMTFMDQVGGANRKEHSYAVEPQSK